MRESTGGRDSPRRRAVQGLRPVVGAEGAERQLPDPDDWAAVELWCESRARAEHASVTADPSARPALVEHLRSTSARPPVSIWWPLVADRVPSTVPLLGGAAARRAERWYLQRLAGRALLGWEAARELDELRAYLGDAYDHARLVGHEETVRQEWAAVGDEPRFYRTSEGYLYDLTAFAMSGTKLAYLADLQRVVPTGSSVLDYGCGIGSDGLQLMERGYDVAFVDFDNPSVAYLRWRLARRGLSAEVHDLDEGVPAGYDAAYAFDVIEHADDPRAFLAELERRADVVAVNFLDEEPDDTELHRPLPVAALLDHAARRGLIRYRLYHGRSHFVIYRGAPGPRPGRARSRAERRLGARLPGAWEEALARPPRTGADPAADELGRALARAVRGRRRGTRPATVRRVTGEAASTPGGP